MEAGGRKLFFLSASLLGKAGGASCIGAELAVIAVLTRVLFGACILRDIDKALYPLDPSVVRIFIIIHAGISFFWQEYFPLIYQVREGLTNRSSKKGPAYPVFCFFHLR